MQEKSDSDVHTTMSLEDLLKPVKNIKEYSWDIADEWLLRQYTKATQWWEKKGHDKYSLCTGIILGSCGYLALRNVADPRILIEPYKKMPIQENKTVYALAFGYWGLIFHDMMYTLDAKSNSRLGGNISGETTVSKFQYASRKLQRIVRLPALIFGGSGIYDFAVALKNNFSSDTFAENSDAVIMGGLIIALASSMYIKDTNPKLL